MLRSAPNRAFSLRRSRLPPRFSLLVGASIRFHGRMPKKQRRVLSGALLTAAAAALTVKGVLTSPVRAVVPADELQRDLLARKDAVLVGSKTVLTQAQQRLVSAIVRVPPGASPPSPAPTACAPTACSRIPSNTSRGSSTWRLA